MDGVDSWTSANGLSGYTLPGASEAIRLVRPELYHFLLQALLLKRPNPVQKLNNIEHCTC